ncbi:hypothetical protein STENM36S_03260 [Streptomyces tendae]
MPSAIINCGTVEMTPMVIVFCVAFQNRESPHNST